MLLTGCTSTEEPPSRRPSSTPPTTTSSRAPDPVALPKGTPQLTDVIPAPVRVQRAPEENFPIDSATAIVPAKSPDAEHAADLLRDTLRRSTGFELPATDRGQVIELRVDDELPAQGYRLEVTRTRITLSGADRAGLLNGVQTLLQLLPPEVVAGKRPQGELVVAGGTITDHPRYAYRGTMLDVARHFFDADTVKRHIDRIARYKINYLHLHLADDQGWRIAIRKWPKLTTVGGRTQVDGGKGGWFSRREYSSIVRYAQRRGVTIVPEIDMPGHTQAALVAYPQLSCDGRPRRPYTGTQVGFSTLCVTKQETYRFVQDVISELAELTPGPYLHIGGDEAQSTKPAEYRTFMRKVLPMVLRAGKKPVGWHEYAQVDLPKEAVVQYWRIERADDATAAAARAGNKVLMSPADKSYIDMKYFESDSRGNKWAGPVSVQTAYDWDPAGYLKGVDDSAVLGVEAPLWTELVETEEDIERQAFPRIAAVAEVGWTPQSRRDWNDFRQRLAQHGPRLKAQGVAFHPSPDVPW